MPQIKRIQRGELRPRSIQVRLMLPRIEDVRLAIPRRVDDSNDPRPLIRLAYLRDLHTGALKNVLEDLAVGQGSPRGEEGPLQATVASRTVPITPVVKSYVINGRLGLTGYYVIEEREVKLLDGETVAIYDVLGIGAELYRQRPAQVEESQRWFNSLWDTIAVGDGRDHEPGSVTG
jgi:hypothetical protein